MKIPFGDLSRQYKKYKKEFDNIISSVFANRNFILGENLSNFEKNFAGYIEIKVAEEIVSLPIFPDLEDVEVDYVIKSIKKFFN